MTTAQQLMTADQLFDLPGNGNRRELLKGELREMAPAGGEHGALAFRLSVRLGHFVEAHQLGVAFAAETGFILSRNPDTVRAPDIAFVSRDRIPPGGIPRKFVPGAPDLAVEVLSSSDTAIEVEEKVSDWLGAGSRLVWVVNPQSKTVTVYRPGPQVRIVHKDEVLTGEDVVPGFEIRVGDIFG